MRLAPNQLENQRSGAGGQPSAGQRVYAVEGAQPEDHAPIGGLVSSTLLTLIMLPILYRWLEGRSKDPMHRGKPDKPD